MMSGKLIINGIDMWTKYGVFLENGSYEKLLSGTSMKPYTTNRSRMIDGKSIKVSNPRVEDRDVVLVFCFADIGSSFLNRLSGFLGDLEVGGVDGFTFVNTPEINTTFKFVYLSNMNLNQTALSIGKIAVRFNEPNPKDRE